MLLQRTSKKSRPLKKNRNVTGAPGRSSAAGPVRSIELQAGEARRNTHPAGA